MDNEARTGSGNNGGYSSCIANHDVRKLVAIAADTLVIKLTIAGMMILLIINLFRSFFFAILILSRV